MDEIESLIQKVVDEQDNLNDGQKLKVRNAARDLLKGGKRPLEALQLPPEIIEAFYSHAYFLYKSAKYGLAGHIFQLLAFLSPYEARFYLGLAACLHQMKHYERAAFMYQVASNLDMLDPMPSYYESDCWMELKEWKLAILSLRAVIEKGKGKKVFDVLVDRASLTLDKLELDHPEFK